MIVPAESVVPSQNFLKPQPVKYIFECLGTGQLDNLPPIPIVRHGEAGKLIAIDGHNLLAVRAFLKQDQEVHLATSPIDGLPPTSDANNARNADLARKFGTVLAECQRLQAQGIATFHDLIVKYEELFK